MAKILLVEDEDQLRRVMRDLLERTGPFATASTTVLPVRITLSPPMPSAARLANGS